MNKSVSDYFFKHPCKSCGRQLPLRNHLKHFKEHHLHVNVNIRCHLCLKMCFSGKQKHLKICASNIAIARKLPPIILEKSRYQRHLKENIWNRMYADNTGAVPINSSIRIFDSLPVYQYQTEKEVISDQAVIEFVKCMKQNRMPVVSLNINQKNLSVFITWLRNNKSNIFDENVIQALSCLAEFRKNEWYHLIIAKYHFDKFVRLASSSIELAPFRCLCVCTPKESTRTIHIHLLAYIKDYSEFNRKCWRILKSPTSQRYKMILKIKDLNHMFSVLFYISQERQCSTKAGSKHYDIYKRLSTWHEALTLLVFRTVLYSKLEDAKNKMAMRRFDIYEMLNQKSKKRYASSAKSVVQVVFPKPLFQDSKVISSNVITPNTVTHTENGFLQIEPMEEEEESIEPQASSIETEEITHKRAIVNSTARKQSIVHTVDILQEAEELDYWLIWKVRKVAVIKDLIETKGAANTIAVHTKQEHIAFYGDSLRIVLPKTGKVTENVLKANVTNKTILFADQTQLQIVRKLAGCPINDPIVINISEEEEEDCFETAKSLYEHVSAAAIHL